MMLKRIWLFLLANFAILLILVVTITILTSIFGIDVWGYYTGQTNELVPLFIFSAIVGFAWSFFSLATSRIFAKWIYKPKMINSDNIHSLSSKERLVYDVVLSIAEREHIKMPEVWIYESADPNAFATWPTKNRALVCVSSWLLEIMDKDEIEGVVGHEMAHVINWDMVTMTLLQWIINTFVVFISRIFAYIFEKVILRSNESNPWIYYWVSFVFQIIIWILASIIVSWFSRYREFRADEGSSFYVWKEKMIAALKKLQKYQDAIISDDSDRLATAKIATKKSSSILKLFASHPDLELRIKNLENKNIA